MQPMVSNPRIAYRNKILWGKQARIVYLSHSGKRFRGRRLPGVAFHADAELTPGCFLRSPFRAWFY